MTQPPDDWNEDEDHDPPRLCFYNGSYCDRAFCDDYGCADEAGVPFDEYDVAAGSIHPDELILPLPKLKRQRGRKP